MAAAAVGQKSFAKSVEQESRKSREQEKKSQNNLAVAVGFAFGGTPPMLTDIVSLENFEIQVLILHDADER